MRNSTSFGIAARVSSVDQNLDRQIAALRAVGCGEIYRERVSGNSIRNRPEFEKAIDHLGTGDTLGGRNGTAPHAPMTASTSSSASTATAAFSRCPTSRTSTLLRRWGEASSPSS